MPDLSFSFFAVVEFFSDPFEQEFFMAFYDFRKLKQPIRVRGSVKFC
jgi:hypothetical protein